VSDTSVRAIAITDFATVAALKVTVIAVPLANPVAVNSV
jgi:hypothetical protein